MCDDHNYAKPAASSDWVPEDIACEVEVISKEAQAVEKNIPDAPVPRARRYRSLSFTPTLNPIPELALDAISSAPMPRNMHNEALRSVPGRNSTSAENLDESSSTANFISSTPTVTRRNPPELLPIYRSQTAASIMRRAMSAVSIVPNLGAELKAPSPPPSMDPNDNEASQPLESIAAAPSPNVIEAETFAVALTLRPEVTEAEPIDTASKVTFEGEPIEAAPSTPPCAAKAKPIDTAPSVTAVASLPPLAATTARRISSRRVSAPIYYGAQNRGLATPRRSVEVQSIASAPSTPSLAAAVRSPPKTARRISSRRVSACGYYGQQNPRSVSPRLASAANDREQGAPMPIVRTGAGQRACRPSATASNEPSTSTGGNTDGTEPYYKVESILGWRLNAKKKVKYFIKWKGFGKQHNVWVTSKKFSNPLKTVENYFTKEKPRKRKPAVGYVSPPESDSSSDSSDTDSE